MGFAKLLDLTYKGIFKVKFCLEFKRQPGKTERWKISTFLLAQ